MTKPECEWEVVGMNGNPLSECGYVLPVVRRHSDRCCCVFSLSRGRDALQWYSEDEVREFADEQRWTKFSNPLRFPTQLLNFEGNVIEQPLVLFVTQKFRDRAAIVELPNSIGHAFVEWVSLGDLPVSASVASNSAVMQQVNSWGQSLLQLFDQRAEAGDKEEVLLDLSDFALSAAADSEIRYRAYLRCCSVIEPERARQTYDFFVCREFPNSTWDAFQEDFLNLRQRWLAMVKLKAPTAFMPNAGRAPAKLASISRSAARNLIGAARVAP